MSEVVHDLKTWDQFYDLVEAELKGFEVRKNDRNFKVGDILLLRRWRPEHGYSGPQLRKKITYITDLGDWIPEAAGYVVLGWNDVKLKNKRINELEQKLAQVKRVESAENNLSLQKQFDRERTRNENQKKEIQGLQKKIISLEVNLQAQIEINEGLQNELSGLKFLLTPIGPKA